MIKRRKQSKIKAESTTKTSLIGIERKEKGDAYIKNHKNLRRICKDKPHILDVIALKTINPKNKPFLHLTYKYL